MTLLIVCFKIRASILRPPPRSFAPQIPDEGLTIFSQTNVEEWKMDRVRCHVVSTFADNNKFAEASHTTAHCLIAPALLFL